jgi:hypothetical protein
VLELALADTSLIFTVKMVSIGFRRMMLGLSMVFLGVLFIRTWLGVVLGVSIVVMRGGFDGLGYCDHDWRVGSGFCGWLHHYV